MMMLLLLAPGDWLKLMGDAWEPACGRVEVVRMYNWTMFSSEGGGKEIGPEAAEDKRGQKLDIEKLWRKE
jgi:hypothetical protein